MILRGEETILLVDDADMILDVGTEILEALGYTVFLARSGKEAIEIYKNHTEEIAMIILDIVMPGMGGAETYDRLQQINPDSKVLLSSGYSIDGQATEILRRSCNGFIQKPFNNREVILQDQGDSGRIEGGNDSDCQKVLRDCRAPYGVHLPASPNNSFLIPIKQHLEIFQYSG